MVCQLSVCSEFRSSFSIGKWLVFVIDCVPFHESTPALLKTMNLFSLRENMSSLICSNSWDTDSFWSEKNKGGRILARRCSCGVIMKPRREAFSINRVAFTFWMSARRLAFVVCLEFSKLYACKKILSLVDKVESLSKFAT